MQACMVAFDILLAVMVSACQDLAASSRHRQELLLKPIFCQSLLPNYLLQTLLVSLQISSLIVLDVQTGTDEKIVGMAGDKQGVEDPRGRMCKNVATGRLLCIKRTGWVGFIDVSGVITSVPRLLLRLLFSKLTCPPSSTTEVFAKRNSGFPTLQDSLEKCMDLMDEEFLGLSAGSTIYPKYRTCIMARPPK